MKFHNQGIIKYPGYINTVSIYIGRLRDMMNAEMNEDNPGYQRGNRSQDVNVWGVKGELIVQHFLHLKGVKHTSAPLIHQKPVQEADIMLDNNYVCVDVKTLRPDGKHLLVNEKAHLKTKGVNYYWFIQPFEKEARYWIYSFSEVDKWPVENFKYTDAYCKLIKEE